jgi:GT2 family glycosyltransferase
MKNFFKIAKTEGMDSVEEHYRLVEEVEHSKLYPFEANQYDVTQVNEKNKQISEYEEIEFVRHKNPMVSIVIPVYNQFNYTYHCLKSILAHTLDVPYEILLADDCSTDITKKISKVVRGIHVIRNSKNLRFLLNCNHASKAARGKYILFLNNDTQVQHNWLKSLINIMECDETVGLVGSKLVYSNGWLQEAGGIVWNDASAWNYGNKKNPGDAEYNYVKEVDYISGACMMINRKLWDEIGGFDERYAPAYYEDVDLAFEVRKRNYKVIYQPLSVVVHFEGVSNGTDTKIGQKSYQEVNRQKFYDKWKEKLINQNFPNGEQVFLAKDRSRFKKHILVIDHYVPHFDKDAGGRGTYMYLNMFVEFGYKVTFIGDNFYRHEPYTTILNQKGIEILYGKYYFDNWEMWLKEHMHYFDYVYLQRPHISIKYIDIVKKYGHAKVFYYAVDLHFLREYREFMLTKNENNRIDSEKWKEIEHDLFEKADVGHVVGSHEQEIVQKAFPHKPIRNIPLYIYERLPDNINVDFNERRDLLYVGGFGHKPNIDAVMWFAEKVLPIILRVYPNMKWHVVGGGVPLEIQDLESNNIAIEGFISDEELQKLYMKCKIAVVPLRFGAGVKGKVVEAAYYQIPLVTTSVGAEGLSTKEGNMLIVDDENEMADAIIQLYQDEIKLRSMSIAGKEFISKYFIKDEAIRVLQMDMDI